MEGGGGDTSRNDVIGSRLRSMWASLTLAEFSGAFGDMGTLLPVLVSLSKSGQVSLTSSLVFGGIFNIATALLYDIPMCVQPMKAIAATALASNLSSAQVVSAGMSVSAIALFLGITGLIQVVNKHIPMAIVRGIQLGAGFTLITKGTQIVLQSGMFDFAGYHWMDNAVIAMLSFLLVLILYRARLNLSALILFVTGVVLAIIRIYTQGGSKPSIGTNFPSP
eukprot:jgi/Hompol1/2874/HPOL_002373-RA